MPTRHGTPTPTRSVPPLRKASRRQSAADRLLAAVELAEDDALAHAEFTFNRFVDDYAFHDFVRPDLNAWLDQHGTPDHTYLLKDLAAAAGDRNASLLWNRADELLRRLYPQYHIAAIRVTLPWDRTFETQIEVALAPQLPR